MVKETELYDRLGVSTKATPDEIKRGFRIMAMKWHPDKNPSPDASEKFKELNEAYEILSDEDKRERYDRFGKDAFKEGGGGGGFGGEGMENIFRHFFGSDPFGGEDDFGFSGRKQQRTRKTKDIVFELQLTLEELYNGCTKKKEISKYVLCNKCEGRGHTAPAKKNFTCSECSGNGMTYMIRQVGPGMITKQQVRCGACNGEGEAIPAKDKCKTCVGQKVMEAKKTLSVDVEKGMREGEKIVFSKESSEVPGCIPGDVIFIVKEKAHSIFQREGVHLFMEKEVSLVNALTGCQFFVPHLDNRQILIQTSPGDIINPGDSREIRNEGMPVHSRPYEHGNLYIKFKVKFPTRITNEQITSLQKTLPDYVKAPQNKDNTPIVYLSLVDPESLNDKRYNQEYNNAYDESDDEEETQGVPCNQQ